MNTKNKDQKVRKKRCFKYINISVRTKEVVRYGRSASVDIARVDVAVDDIKIPMKLNFCCWR